MSTKRQEPESEGCGCFLICIGLGFVLLCLLHGCAAIVSALKS